MMFECSPFEKNRFEKEKIKNNPDKFTSVYAAMEAADCEEKLRTKQILPLKVN
jgi:hypothetical protein